MGVVFEALGGVIRVPLPPRTRGVSSPSFDAPSSSIDAPPARLAAVASETCASPAPGRTGGLRPPLHKGVLEDGRVAYLLRLEPEAGP